MGRPPFPRLAGAAPPPAKKAGGKPNVSELKARLLALKQKASALEELSAQREQRMLSQAGAQVKAAAAAPPRPQVEIPLRDGGAPAVDDNDEVVMLDVHSDDEASPAAGAAAPAAPAAAPLEAPIEAQPPAMEVGFLRGPSGRDVRSGGGTQIIAGFVTDSLFDPLSF